MNKDMDTGMNTSMPQTLDFSPYCMHCYTNYLATFFIIEYITKIKSLDFQKLHLAPSQKLS